MVLKNYPRFRSTLVYTIKLYIHYVDQLTLLSSNIPNPKSQYKIIVSDDVSVNFKIINGYSVSIIFEYKRIYH